MDNFKIKLRLIKFSDQIYYAVDELHVNTYIKVIQGLFNDSRNIIELNEYMFGTHANDFFEVDEERYNALLDKAFVIDSNKLQGESELLMTACNYQGDGKQTNVETGAGGDESSRNRKVVVFVDGLKVILALYCVTILSVSIKTALDNLDKNGKADMWTVINFICDIINYDSFSIDGVTQFDIFKTIDKVTHGFVGTFFLKDKLECIASSINGNFTAAYEKCKFDNHANVENSILNFKQFAGNDYKVNREFWKQFAGTVSSEAPMKRLAGSSDYFSQVSDALKTTDNNNPVLYKYYSTVLVEGYDEVYSTAEVLTEKVLGVELLTPNKIFFKLSNRAMATFFGADTEGFFTFLLRNSKRNALKKFSALMASIFSVFIVFKNLAHACLFETVFRFSRGGGYQSTKVEYFGRLMEYVNLTSLLCASMSYSAYYSSATQDLQSFNGFRNTVMSATSVHYLLYYIIGSSFRNVVQRGMDQMFTLLFITVVLERSLEINSLTLGSQYASMFMGMLTFISTFVPFMVFERNLSGNRITNSFTSDVRKTLRRFTGFEDDKDYITDLTLGRIEDINGYTEQRNASIDSNNSMFSLISKSGSGEDKRGRSMERQSGQRQGRSKSGSTRRTSQNSVRTFKVSKNTRVRYAGTIFIFKKYKTYVEVFIDDAIFCRFFNDNNVLERDLGDRTSEGGVILEPVSPKEPSIEEIPDVRKVYLTYNEEGCSFNIGGNNIYKL